MKRRRMLIGGCVGLVLAVILVSVVMMLVQNYQHRREIVEVTNYPAALPSEMQENLEVQLRQLMNLRFDAPADAMLTATVRGESYREEIGEITTASFLLDIDDYRQTYEIMMSWSETVEVPDAILIACPDARLMKYADAECVAMYNDSTDLEMAAANPLYAELPIVVDEFDFAMRASVHYEIRGYFNDDELVVVINDYSGGNLDAAMALIRARGQSVGVDVDAAVSAGEMRVEYFDRAGEI